MRRRPAGGAGGAARRWAAGARGRPGSGRRALYTESAAPPPLARFRAVPATCCQVTTARPGDWREGSCGRAARPERDQRGRRVMRGASRTPSCYAAPGGERAGEFRRGSTRTARLEMVHKSWAESEGHQQGSARRCPSPEPGREPGTPRTPTQETFPVEARTSHATWLRVEKRWLCPPGCAGDKA